MRKMISGKPQVKNPPISSETICLPFNGTLVIRLQISDMMVGRVLINNRSEVNILFREVVIRMNILDGVNLMRLIVQAFKPLMKPYSTLWE